MRFFVSWLFLCIAIIGERERANLVSSERERFSVGYVVRPSTPRACADIRNNMAANLHAEGGVATREVCRPETGPETVSFSAQARLPQQRN